MLASAPPSDPRRVPTPVCHRFHYAVELIGRRWTGAILRALLDGSTRFGDLLAAVPGLSDRLLSERLKELEATGIVVRTVIPSTPVRVEYRVTEKGRALEAVLASITAWAEAWVPSQEAEAACTTAEAKCGTTET